MTRYTDSQANLLAGITAAREEWRGHAPIPQPLDMFKHQPLFHEARLASVVGGEIPERLRPHATVVAAEDAYAAALRRYQPVTYANAADAEWAARNKRSELIREHQLKYGRVEDVLTVVARELRTAAQAFTRTAPTRAAAAKPAAPAAKTPGKAAESTPRRYLTRIHGGSGPGAITVLPDFHA